MKTLILTFGTIIAFIAGSTLFTSCGPGNHQEAESSAQHDMDGHDHDTNSDTMATTFACPMHPEIIGKEGDKCSKCGMALVASTDTKGDGQNMDMPTMASCPMHPEVTGKEGDKCSKCGMALVMADNHDEGGTNQH